MVGEVNTNSSFSLSNVAVVSIPYMIQQIKSNNSSYSYIRAMTKFSLSIATVHLEILDEWEVLALLLFIT